MTLRQIEDRLGKAKGHLYAIQSDLIGKGEQAGEFGAVVEDALTAIGFVQDALEDRVGWEEVR